MPCLTQLAELCSGALSATLHCFTFIVCSWFVNSMLLLCMLSVCAGAQCCKHTPCVMKVQQAYSMCDESGVMLIVGSSCGIDQREGGNLLHPCISCSTHHRVIRVPSLHLLTCDVMVGGCWLSALDAMPVFDHVFRPGCHIQRH
jgi:hypothetical protein